MEKERIPISVSLTDTLAEEQINPPQRSSDKRLVYLSCLAVVIAAITGLIARLLVGLINFFTNIFFFGQFTLTAHSPAQNHLGAWVILIPVLGGIIIGGMALYGSKAIRGHGIPEAMEQILTNESRIKPSITFLKPLSAAISIGTGGPFGAEGPIIATGGALGSTIGQFLHISPYERKILLTAGAASGMAAIFGTPIAAIFLAIELLLFEFSPRSIIPVSLACITGAAMHKLLFSSDPVFAMQAVFPASNSALAIYSGMGVVMGLLAAIVTKAVYAVEDAFEKLPVHWKWWPAIGGLAVGIVGYFAPRTLGVGYANIDDLLTGSLPISILLTLSVMKFLSWCISLGSGTSGGTLAPLLTIGGALGALIGMGVIHLFPHAGISLALAAMVGMSAMFAGSTRALLTSIIFALETTGQSNALLPLLGASMAAYIVSYFLLENTIMTEKIARRGVNTPSSFEPDVLDQYMVKDIIQNDTLVVSAENSIKDVRDWLQKMDPDTIPNYFVIVNNKGIYRGLISLQAIYDSKALPSTPVTNFLESSNVFVRDNDSLKKAVEKMAEANLDILPVITGTEENNITGVLTYKDTLKVYQHKMKVFRHTKQFSLKHQTIRIFLKGKGVLVRK